MENPIITNNITVIHTQTLHGVPVPEQLFLALLIVIRQTLTLSICAPPHDGLLCCRSISVALGEVWRRGLSVGPHSADAHQVRPLLCTTSCCTCHTGTVAAQVLCVPSENFVRTVKVLCVPSESFVRTVREFCAYRQSFVRTVREFCAYRQIARCVFGFGFGHN